VALLGSLAASGQPVGGLHVALGVAALALVGVTLGASRVPAPRPAPALA